MEIDVLIAKYLNGESVSEEIDALNKWREFSQENELIFRQSEEVWYLTHKIHQANTYCNKERTWSGIQKKTCRQYSLSILLKVAGIAASVALILGWTISRFFIVDHQNIIAELPQKITLSVPTGITSKFILPDSTVVWLNSASTISYPNHFGDDNRTVELLGEAFFEVARDENKPFIIESGNLKVNVLGTSFNFKHYDEDTRAILAVETGAVSFSRGLAMNATLFAGEYAIMDNQNLHIKVYDTPFYSSWRDHKIVFRDEPFGNVLHELSRKYNVEFELQNEEFKQYIYTATFDNMGLEDILNLLKMSSPIDYSINTLTYNTPNAYETKKITIF